MQRQKLTTAETEAWTAKLHMHAKHEAWPWHIVSLSVVCGLEMEERRTLDGGRRQDPSGACLI